jgi:hypothetical protein
VTALPALNVVRPALLRPWREAVWRDQDYWTWLLIVLGVLLAIRLLGLVFAETDVVARSRLRLFLEARGGSLSSPDDPRDRGAVAASEIGSDRQSRRVGGLLYCLRNSLLPITVWSRG